ncbi:tRNA epoxyqueuosine(34) reductase QueG [Sulfoacidibacillus thermotolerans]|uniref:tRNA epoxyqueuosine(34) reductase QueG n=1 Tax=Sulfoacidibacillus thermotolerans TaxID=1765684 RepID=A0A2U3D9Z8_SULT2|nr:tRNA epoxyqueuosine(34) reductase QueG [Sulfoacidibacillus thermotolerans]PWI58095.1 tRNA epoxyqueuosine(34) reductase QueG [Sulfoacidibacillus thermotolerans]
MVYEISFASLRQIAYTSGVDVVGVTTADEFPDLAEKLYRYYREGRATGFEHPYSRLRIDPTALLPEAKSIVAIAVPYLTKATRALRRPKGLRGRVSFYAWGRDYHRVLTEQLQVIADALSRQVGREIAYQIAVDTSPLVDRAVAERAGIGWIGKNGMLITKEYGSFVFLGCLLTDILIEPNVSVDELDSCGDCNLCILACPTGALVEPYILDGQRCLSYLTQSKGIIPVQYRKSMGGQLWGCDICQNVCPKNKVSLLGQLEAFTPQADLSYPVLLHILKLSRRAFLREFGHTAAAWRGYYVWRRNAILALGNLRAKEAVPDLLPFLSDVRPEIRAVTAWALQQIDAGGTQPFVALAYAQEQDPLVKQDMEWANVPDVE